MNTKNLFMLLLLCSSFIRLPIAMAEKGHDEHAHDSLTEESHVGDDKHVGEAKEDDGDHDEEGAVSLSAAQMQAAGIIVKPLQFESVRSVISAPGEVKFNSYKTVSITPRITAQVTGYHVVLGETVNVGRRLLTLSSVEMAEAQGALLVADREWKRVKQLGRKVVSASRYTQAKVNWELAQAKVKAYGMTKQQVNKLLASEDFSQANGRFDLVATQSGTVLKENYILGQQVESGKELIRITDESILWIVANVSPSDARQIAIGNDAIVRFDDHQLPAKVIQQYHSLNETTRTTGIRLEVNNPEELLHPGMFVNTVMETSGQSKVLALPEAAVLRSPDGDWQVMVEQDEPGEFKPVEVELLRVSNGMAVIEGIDAGTPVVVQGAFFVQSELAKSGFDIHNH